MGHTVTPPGHTSPAHGRSRESGGRWAHARPGLCGLVALLLVPAVAWAQAMRWPEAVATLAAERTRAETCARVFKRHASAKAATLSRGELCPHSLQHGLPLLGIGPALPVRAFQPHQGCPQVLGLSVGRHPCLPYRGGWPRGSLHPCGTLPTG